MVAFDSYKNILSIFNNYIRMSSQVTLEDVLFQVNIIQLYQANPLFHTIFPMQKLNLYHKKNILQQWITH